MTLVTSGNGFPCQNKPPYIQVSSKKRAFILKSKESGSQILSKKDSFTIDACMVSCPTCKCNEEYRFYTLS